MSTSILGTWNIWWSYWKKKNILIHIVYMNASYKLPYCFSGVQWSPTLLQRPIQDAVVLLEPRKVSMARMKSMKDTSLFQCLWGLSQKETWRAELMGNMAGRRVLCFLYPVWSILWFNHHSFERPFLHHYGHAEERICRCNLNQKGVLILKVLGKYFGSQE